MLCFRNFKLNKIVIADLTILGSALCFGIGFLGQRAVMVDGLGPMTCNAFRFGLSTILLIFALPFLPEQEPTRDSDDDEEDDKKPDKPGESMTVLTQLLGPLAGVAHSIASAKNTVWYWGIVLGFINMGASGFQQWGISMTSASKVAFIAGFDLFLTPIFSLCIPTLKSNSKIEMTTWLAVFLSIFGIFLLSGATMDDMEVGPGETLTLISTVFWTLHITYTDIATNYVDTMSMMCVQLGFVTLMSSILAYWFEPQQWLWDHMYTFFPWLLFLAISEGLGFILMALGQNVAPPTHAAIILSLEGVFAAVTSYLVLHEHLSNRELLGCGLMLSATLMAEVGCPCFGKKSGHGHGHGHSITKSDSDNDLSHGAGNLFSLQIGGVPAQHLEPSPISTMVNATSSAPSGKSTSMQQATTVLRSVAASTSTSSSNPAKSGASTSVSVGTSSSLSSLHSPIVTNSSTTSTANSTVSQPSSGPSSSGGFFGVVRGLFASGSSGGGSSVFSKRLHEKDESDLPLLGVETDEVTV